MISCRGNGQRHRINAVLRGMLRSGVLCMAVKFMKKSCKYCGRMHDIDEVCPKKPRICFRKNKQMKDKFRSSSLWQAKREEIARRDLYLCRVCLSEGRLSRDISVHHIIPLAEDYSRRLDNDNLISLCSYHHEQAERAAISPDRLRELAAIPPALPGP